MFVAFSKAWVAFIIALLSILQQEVEPSSLRANHYEQLPRQLDSKKEAITLIKAGITTQTISVAQVFFGAPASCANETNTTKALTFSATYLDPDTLTPKCGIFGQNVSACFNQTVRIGCDPKTNVSTIDVYVHDKKYTSELKTNNPNLGRCQIGNDFVIPRAVKVRKSFKCGTNSGDGGSTGAGTCSDTFDLCKDGTFCSYSFSTGYTCKPYANVGSNCGGRTLDGIGDECDPNSAFCYFSNFCRFADLPGVCTAFLGNCATDKDCGDPATRYCDEVLGKCKSRLGQDICCTVEADQCVPGLTCLDTGGSVFACRDTRTPRL